MRAFLDEHGLNDLDPLTAQPPKHGDDNSSDFCEDGIYDEFNSEVPYEHHIDTIVNNDEDLQVVLAMEA